MQSRGWFYVRSVRPIRSVFAALVSPLRYTGLL